MLVTCLLAEKNANGTETTKYGSQVKQISSGEQKWIEEIKKREEEKMKMELEKAMKTTAVYNGSAFYFILYYLQKI